MYITKLNLQNFKSYVNEDIEFKNITLLTGLNGAGKSSIFQSLRMFWRYIKEDEPILNTYGQIETLKNERRAREKFVQISIDILDSKYFDLNFDLTDVENIRCEALNKNTIDIDNLNLAYISANRFGPTEYQPIRNSFRDDYNVGINGEYTLDILSKHEEETLPESFKEDPLGENRLLWHVQRWLQEISPNTRIRTEKNEKMNVASFTINGFIPLNVGFGISYTLSIIVQLLYSVILLDKKGINSVVLIENPEAHLHPKGQTKIAEFIAKVSAFGVQVIVETHSDYILDGLRLAVKEGKISHDDTKLYYLELDDEGNTQVRSPQIDSEGFLDEWPENFFDTSLNNSMRLM